MYICTYVHEYVHTLYVYVHITEMHTVETAFQTRLTFNAVKAIWSCVCVSWTAAAEGTIYNEALSRAQAV